MGGDKTMWYPSCHWQALKNYIKQGRMRRDASAWLIPDKVKCFIYLPAARQQLIPCEILGTDPCSICGDYRKQSLFWFWSSSQIRQWSCHGAVTLSYHVQAPRLLEGEYDKEIAMQARGNMFTQLYFHDGLGGTISSKKWCSSIATRPGSHHIVQSSCLVIKGKKMKGCEVSCLQLHG